MLTVTFQKNGHENGQSIMQSKDYTAPEIYFGCKKNTKLPESKQPKDIENEWFVYYYYYRKLTRKMERVRVREGINCYHTIAERYDAAKIVRAATADLLKEGYYPWPKDIVPVDILNNNDETIIGFSAAMDYAWDIKKHELRKASLPDYKSSLNILKEKLIPIGLATMPVHTISRKQIRYILQEIQDERKFSNRRYNNILINISSLFSVLVDEDIIMINPCHAIKRKKFETTDYYNILTGEERKKISDKLSATHKGFYLYISLIRHIGTRRTETLKLRVGDVYLERGIIVIRPEVSKVGKQRILPILNEFREMLEQHIKGKQPNEFIFSEKFECGTKPTHPDTATSWWAKLVVDSEKGLGIKKKMYALKHTAASLYIDHGADVDDVRILLGHSSRNMLDNNYAPSAIERKSARSIIEHAESF